MLTRRTALGGMNEIATVSLRRAGQVNMRVVGQWVDKTRKRRWDGSTPAGCHDDSHQASIGSIEGLPIRLRLSWARISSQGQRHSFATTESKGLPQAVLTEGSVF